MSGKPYPEGVTKVLDALDRMEELAAEIGKLEPAVVRLKAAREEHAALERSVRDALDGMDLEAQGNYGFGGRMGWFVAEMRRQILARRAAL